MWTRPIPSKWLDAWCERLAFIDPTRLTVVEIPGSATTRLQVYPSNQATAQKLLKHFGGSLRKIAPKDWLHRSQNREAIRIGTRFILSNNSDQAIQMKIKYPNRIVLHLPAGLAFGTGDHATTSMILKAISLLPNMDQQTVLDIGTGSGVLALACRAMGSPSVEAFDYDPISTRTARENEKLNFPHGKIRWTTRDLFDWKPKLSYNLITANLFLETLVNHSNKIISALTSGGLLFTSGLLISQKEEAIVAFKKTGLKLLTTQKRNKWIMHTWRKR